MLRREVDVDRQLVTRAATPLVLGPPKTEASVRTVPLPQVVVDEMAAHLAEVPARRADGLVFTLDDGEPITSTGVRAPLATGRAPWSGWTPGPGMHALRHYYASLLIRLRRERQDGSGAAGARVSAPKRWTPTSHLWPDSDDRTREAVDARRSVLLRTLCGQRQERLTASAAGQRPMANGPACRPGSVPPPSPGAGATIHLRPPLPTASSSPPAHSGEQPSDVRCLTLLQAGFAEPRRSPGVLVVSCSTVSPLPLMPRDVRGGLFSVALSRGSPRVGVTHHLALRSPDLPRGVASTRSPGRPVRARSVAVESPPAPE